MSTQTTASIVTNGLVFSCDMNSRRSYKGPPLQNKLSGLSPTVTSGTGYVLTGGTEIVNIPGVGDTLVTNCFLQNNYSSVSSWCCVNFMNFGGTGSNLGSGIANSNKIIVTGTIAGGYAATLIDGANSGYLLAANGNGKIGRAHV